MGCYAFLLYCLLRCLVSESVLDVLLAHSVDDKVIRKKLHDDGQDLAHFTGLVPQTRRAVKNSTLHRVDDIGESIEDLKVLLVLDGVVVEIAHAGTLKAAGLDLLAGGGLKMESVGVVEGSFDSAGSDDDRLDVPVLELEGVSLRHRFHGVFGGHVRIHGGKARHGGDLTASEDDASVSLLGGALTEQRQQSVGHGHLSTHVDVHLSAHSFEGDQLQGTGLGEASVVDEGMQDSVAGLELLAHLLHGCVHLFLLGDVTDDGHEVGVAGELGDVGVLAHGGEDQEVLGEKHLSMNNRAQGEEKHESRQDNKCDVFGGRNMRGNRYSMPLVNLYVERTPSLLNDGAEYKCKEQNVAEITHLDSLKTDTTTRTGDKNSKFVIFLLSVLGISWEDDNVLDVFDGHGENDGQSDHFGDGAESSLYEESAEKKTTEKKWAVHIIEKCHTVSDRVHLLMGGILDCAVGGCKTHGEVGFAFVNYLSSEQVQPKSAVPELNFVSNFANLRDGDACEKKIVSSSQQ